MSLSTSSIPDEDYLTDEEWNEMVALKSAIEYNPSSVHPESMERFTALFVRSLYGKGDDLNSTKVHSLMTQQPNSDFNSPIVPLEECDPEIANRALRHHPGTPFEEYCSLHPDASECRVYES